MSPNCTMSLYLLSLLGAQYYLYVFFKTWVGLTPLCIILATCIVYFFLVAPFVDPLFLLFCHVEAPSTCIFCALSGSCIQSSLLSTYYPQLPSEGNGTVLILPMRKLRLGQLKCFGRSSSSQRSNPRGKRHPTWGMLKSSLTQRLLA